MCDKLELITKIIIFLLSSQLYQIEVRILEHLNAIDLCLEGDYRLVTSDPMRVATGRIVIGTSVTISCVATLTELGCGC